MSAPNVSIVLSNGNLGGTPPGADGISAMVLTGVASGALALGVPKVIFTLEDATDLGIDVSGTNASAYRHIKEFYDGAGEGAELYIMLVADTVTLAQMADNTYATGLKKLVDFSQGRVRLAGIARTPAVGYTPTLTSGIDQDAITAATNGQVLTTAFAAKQMPFRLLIEARGFLIANIGTLLDLHTLTKNRCGFVLGSTDNDGSASVGLALGKAAAVAVSRNIGRVRDGSLPVTAAFIGDTAIEDTTAVDLIHDKGYIFMRTYTGRAGYFFNDDPMAAPAGDDYKTLTNGRVIDKASRITYDTFLNEVNDDTEIADDGTIPLGTIKYLEMSILQQINLQMAGEISFVSVFIDPAQNVISTNKVRIKLRITPVGYFKSIEVDLGFSNPAL